MKEIFAYLVTSSGLLPGWYKEELIVKDNRLWVPFFVSGGNEWTLQCPSKIVIEEYVV